MLKYVQKSLEIENNMEIHQNNLKNTEVINRLRQFFFGEVNMSENSEIESQIMNEVESFLNSGGSFDVRDRSSNGDKYWMT